MTKILVGALAVFAMSLVPSTRARSAESTLGTSGQSSASQLMLTALAEPGSQTVQVTDDLHFSFGLKIWFNKWQNAKFGLGTNPDHILNMDDSGIGYIPTLGVRYKDFFTSASGMFATAYKFDVPSTVHSTTSRISLVSEPAAKKLMSISGIMYTQCWRFRSGIRVFFKLSAFRNHLLEQPTVTRMPACAIEPSQQKYNYNGPTVGLSTNVPLGEGGLGLLPWGLNIYGNGGGGYMNATASFECAQLGNHAAYGVVEGGLAYKPSQLPLAIYSRL